MSAKQAKENVIANGHANILAKHPATLMFTKDKELSKTGDCIVAVSADKAVADLGQQFKNLLRKPNAKLTITIEVDKLREQINAVGSPKLTLTHLTDMVIRKSNYICSRTLAIHADKAASDLPRDLVQKLKSSKQKVKITLAVSVERQG
ncbi:MAG: DUF371 domain-containing protein [Candidatus Bathyarchaeota archaeon]|nr:DUF371 domain-containing protein [Candidatus Bathyarchaeota archaeon]